MKLKRLKGAGITIAAAAALAAVLLLAPLAVGGRHGRTAVVKDAKDGTGKLYPGEVYKRCDLTEVKAQVKRKELVIKASTVGKQEFANTDINLNTKGSTKSDPEYRASAGGGITNIKKNTYDAGGSKTKLKDKGKSLQHKILLKAIGKPKKTGFQAQTCGEGAVDIAPGGNYFDDRSFDGTVEHKYKSIKTGS